MSRSYSYVQSCTGPGNCPEREFLLFSTLRERDAHTKYRYQHPFLCSRHARPEDVVTSARSPLTITYTVVDRHRVRMLSSGEGRRTMLGGPFEGFMVFAEDFPVGTQVMLTVAVVIAPEASSHVQ